MVHRSYYNFQKGDDYVKRKYRRIIDVRIRSSVHSSNYLGDSSTNTCIMDNNKRYKEWERLLNRKRMIKEMHPDGKITYWIDYSGYIREKKDVLKIESPEEILEEIAALVEIWRQTKGGDEFRSWKRAAIFY